MNRRKIVIGTMMSYVRPSFDNHDKGRIIEDIGKGEKR
jgi:hypothetical protein